MAEKFRKNSTDLPSKNAPIPDENDLVFLTKFVTELQQNTD
jgi:hypothetical protein